MYACVRETCVYTHTHIMHIMHTCIHVFMYPCIHVFMYSCIHVFMYSCFHVFMYSCIRVFGTQVYESMYLKRCVLYMFGGAYMQVCWRRPNLGLEVHMHLEMQI